MIFLYLCAVIRIVTILLTALWALSVHAVTKIKYPGGRQYMFRLTLTDKLQSPYRLDRPLRWLSSRSIERRRRQGLPIDSTDLPVSPRYLSTIKAQRGIDVVGTSRWNNTVLIHTADTAALKPLKELPFIRKAELVWLSPDSIERKHLKPDYHDYFSPWDSVKHEYYGGAKEQIEALNGQRLHSIGLQGRSMTIAVLDGGFQNVNHLISFYDTRIEGFRDLLWHNPLLQASNLGDELIYHEADHGTRVLSALAANSPEVMVGTAPEARYWLLRCEDQQTEQPVEEDYWAMAAEIADSAGADIINSSLGYSYYDAPHASLQLNDLDGRSTLISRSASMLVRKGIVMVSSAGNTGMGPWKKICVPADAHDIITVGAINPQGKNAPFSAVGPSQDGRVKPDIMAYGSPATLISGRGTVVHDMGTSFAAPIVSGLVACLWQALPSMTASDIIELIRQTADNYQHPNNVYGYGKPNFWRAYMVGKATGKKTNSEE